MVADPQQGSVADAVGENERRRVNKHIDCIRALVLLLTRGPNWNQQACRDLPSDCQLLGSQPLHNYAGACSLRLYVWQLKVR